MLLIDPITCLAAAIYFESRSEIPHHQTMVADVIMNRVASKRYPNDVCGVIKDYKQFSFLWDGTKLDVPDDENPSWNTAMDISWGILNKKRLQTTLACNYARDYIDNKWTKTFKDHETEQHGLHVFYSGGC